MSTAWLVTGSSPLTPAINGTASHLVDALNGPLDPTTAADMLDGGVG